VLDKELDVEQIMVLEYQVDGTLVISLKARELRKRMNKNQFIPINE
jgi:hypothetical protein